jgi:uncharacterized membrane protein YeiH
MESILLLASFIGSVAFAFSGFLVGVRRKFDWMGVFIVSFLTANGGGIVRDLLISQTPAVLHSNTPIYLVGGTMVLSIALKLHTYPDLERRGWFVTSDAIGLVAFAVTGSLAGIQAGFPLFGVVALSLITAVGGGLLRDMLVGNTPLILHEGFYGSVAILLGIALHTLARLQLLSPLMVLLVCAAAFGLRLIAHARGWHLPKVG